MFLRNRQTNEQEPPAKTAYKLMDSCLVNHAAGEPVFNASTLCAVVVTHPDRIQFLYPADPKTVKFSDKPIRLQSKTFAFDYAALSEICNSGELDPLVELSEFFHEYSSATFFLYEPDPETGYRDFTFPAYTSETLQQSGIDLDIVSID